MSTLGELKAFITSDLRRSNLVSDIAAHITRAIEFYADERLIFNEGRRSVTTTGANQYVDLPAGLRKIDLVQVIVGGTRYDLAKESMAELERLHGYSDTTGQPVQYAVFEGQFRLWPTPNTTYTITVIGLYDEPALANDDASNGWTTEAHDLIRYRTVYTISRDILRDDKRMRNAGMAMEEARNELANKANTLQATGRMQASF